MTAARPEVAKEVYEAMYETILRSTVAQVGSRQAAEDIVHDAFAQLVRRQNEVHNPRSYVRRCVENGIRAEYRHVRVHRNYVDRLPRTPEGLALSEHAAIMEALERLPARQRRAALLFFVDDRSTAQIAEIMGIHQGPVRKLLSRARATLRSELWP